MKPFLYLSLPALLLAVPALCQTTPPPGRPVVVSPVVGEAIDAAEKARFGLFVNYAADEFQEARFTRALAPDSALTLRTRLRDGRLVARPFTEAEFAGVRSTIQARLEELGTAAPVAAAPTSGARGLTPGELLGRRYEVELQSGTSFSGILRAANAQELEFETVDLGLVKAPRTNIKRLSLLSGTRNYFNIGNGNRIFFAPTGRGLRKGEGSLQDVSLFLVGANYGVNDYLSVGGYVTLIPGLGINQFLVLTPKITLPVSEQFGVGAGVLYLRIPTFGFGSNGRQSYGAGILYGTATYGSADNNFTAGLGYGFFEQEIGTEPVFQFGGQTRVSRRLSLLSENYLVNQAGMGGLYGVKISWPRTSFGIAAAYTLSFTAANDIGGGTGLIPVYYDFTYRFGKTTP